MKLQGIGRRELLIGASGLLAVPAIVRAQGTSGVALVIGNSKYLWELSLPNVRRDVADVAKRFETMGLKTELLENADRQAMLGAIDRFRSSIQRTGFAGFYFAGHGVTVGSSLGSFTPYIVPVDADLTNPSAAQGLIEARSIGAAMREAAGRLLVFDACRNNPADGWRQRTLTQFAGAKGGRKSDSASISNTLMLFSTAPGYVALDGPAGQNSPFAAALLHQMEAPSIDLQALPEKLRRDLLIRTEGQQLLVDESSYTQPFALSSRGGDRNKAAGWASDPSRIVELGNAYAYSQQSGCPLPAGLVAIKPASGAGWMVGSLKIDFSEHLKGVLVVLTVEENRTAHIVMSSKSTQASLAGWRVIRAPISGKSFEYLQQDETARNVFDWKNANSGTISNMPVREGRMSPNSGRFSRLDG